MTEFSLASSDMIEWQSSFMSQSIPTGHISPPRNPWKNFFERANPGHPGKFFLSNSLPPGQKMMVEFSGWGKIFPNSKKLLLELAKDPYKLRKLRDSTNFLFGELNKTYFRLKQNHWKVFKYSSLDTQLKQKCIVLKAIVHWRILLSFTKV